MLLHQSLFDIKIKDNMKLAISNNEIYTQSLLFLYEKTTDDMIIVTNNLTEATKIFNNIKKYVKNVFLFPEDEYITKKALAVSPEFLFMRLDLLNNIKNTNKKIVIAHLNSYIKYLPTPSLYENKKIVLKENTKLDRDELINKLISSGYRRESIVTNTSEFAVRGYVVDVFPIGEDRPVRIEFFDNLIENIKIFDEDSQLTIKTTDKIIINPVKDDFLGGTATILEYLKNPLIVYQDFDNIKKSYKDLIEQIKYYEKDSDEYKDLTKISVTNTIYVDLINNVGNYDYNFKATSVKKYNGNYNEFINDLTKYSLEKKVFLCIQNHELIKKIKSEKLDFSHISFLEESLNEGFIYNDTYYFSSSDLTSTTKPTEYKPNYKLGTRISNLKNLKIGDYVVHKTNGIGIYAGIKTLEKNGVKKDYVLIEYKGEDKLYLPVEDIDKLYKYSSRDGARPKIYKLNSLEWEKTKQKIRKKISDIREQLIELYKNREIIKVTPFKKDEVEQELFEQEFSFSATADQIRAVIEIKNDLESNKPMDRLLCGDVGYGKTEVIFRAIFKTVMNEKQVAYLCPTTILSFQQYRSAKERFKNYAINIEVINRYTSLKEAKRIIDDLKAGKIDVIFGTHRLLSKDIEFSDLGLLVIDEEHRFGVTHKEKIKEIKNNVHVLSVSATPIPRTLQMSLVGIRDMSLIETAPSNRLPVQTYVINYDEILIKEVISKELSRNGQVFILYNKIENIQKLQYRFQQLIPEAKIKYAHGKMNKEEIQDIMYQFMNNEFEILIATTIIENGIDIPNANTIIVINADYFGLSQLYQIRGRVGRSDRMAYAYLMYDGSKLLNDTATKRLNAIKEFTELGSGYKISMRDLSIRGAGDILGSEQAGFIDSVGVDMYLELINNPEELNTAEEKKPILDEVSTHIDSIYSEEDEIIIELHKKINSITSISDLNDVMLEIQDRFGVLNDDLRLYMLQELLTSLIEKSKIIIFSNDRFKITFRLKEEELQKLNVEELFVYATRISSKFHFEYRSKSLYISLNKLNLESPYQIYLIKLVTYIIKNKKTQ